MAIDELAKQAAGGNVSEVKFLSQLDIETKTEKKYCRFKKYGIKYVDYKDPDFLLKFVNEQGKILPRRLTGTSLKFQRKVSQRKKEIMEVILKQDVENLGLEFDVVNVKPGYARNYLIPKGFALLATPKNKAALEATLKEREAEEAAQIKTANDVVAKLKEVVVSIPAKVGAGDKLFGSVNNLDLAEALAKAGVNIDKKYIKII